MVNAWCQLGVCYWVQKVCLRTWVLSCGGWSSQPLATEDDVVFLNLLNNKWTNKKKRTPKVKWLFLLYQVNKEGFKREKVSWTAGDWNQPWCYCDPQWISTPVVAPLLGLLFPFNILPLPQISVRLSGCRLNMSVQQLLWWMDKPQYIQKIILDIVSLKTLLFPSCNLPPSFNLSSSTQQIQQAFTCR